MDHVVYTDAKDSELAKILSGTKTMIIRGAAGRKLPYGRVQAGDTLYFLENNAEGKVRARASVAQVTNSDALTPEQAAALVQENQPKLQLGAKQLERWSGKRYLVLIEIQSVESLEPFSIDKSQYGNMDDWLPVGDIRQVRL